MKAGQPEHGRAILYLRVSTEEQAEQYGLTVQRADLRRYAKAQRYTIIEELTDDGYSGADSDRPGLDKLRRMIAESAVDVILVWDFSRLARKAGLQAVLVEAARKKNIRIETPRGPMDNSAEGQFQMQVLAAVAEFEREKILARTMPARRHKAMGGHIVGGRVPYGYKYLGRADGERGRYEIDSDQAAVVRRIFASYAAGDSTREIVCRLNAEGIRPQRAARWCKSSIHRILTSELYSGTAHYNRRKRQEPENPGPEHAARKNKKTILRERDRSEWIPIPVPAIINRALFDLASQRKARNLETQRGQNSGRYLLRGLLRCKCGQRISGCPMHGKPYYRCVGRDRTRAVRCSSPWIKASRVETAVWDAVVSILREPGYLFGKVREQKDAPGFAVDDAGAEIKRIDGALRDVSRRIDRAMDTLLDASDSLQAALRAKLLELDSQKLKLVVEKEKWEGRRAVYGSDAARKDAASEFCRWALRGIDGLDFAGRQKLLGLLVDEISVDGNSLLIRGELSGSMVANRTQRQHVVRAGRGHFQRAARSGLAAHVAKIRQAGVCGRIHVGGRRGGMEAVRLIQELHNLGKMAHAEDPHAGCDGGFGGVVGGHQQVRDAGASRADGHR